jgi:hypothetical protein
LNRDEGEIMDRSTLVHADRNGEYTPTPESTYKK